MARLVQSIPILHREGQGLKSQKILHFLLLGSRIYSNYLGRVAQLVQSIPILHREGQGLKSQKILHFLLLGSRIYSNYLGRVAQLVQSTWFTPKGSGVRIPSRPQEFKISKIWKSFLFYRKLAQLVQSIPILLREGGAGIQIPLRPLLFPNLKVHLL